MDYFDQQSWAIKTGATFEENQLKIAITSGPVNNN